MNHIVTEDFRKAIATRIKRTIGDVLGKERGGFEEPIMSEITTQIINTVFVEVCEA